MNIKINGKITKFNGKQVPVEEVLRQSNVKNIEMVTVQLNGTFIAKEQLGSTLIRENDEIDFLYFMGGGSKILIKNSIYGTT